MSEQFSGYSGLTGYDLVGMDSSDSSDSSSSGNEQQSLFTPASALRNALDDADDNANNEDGDAQLEDMPSPRIPRSPGPENIQGEEQNEIPFWRDPIVLAEAYRRELSPNFESDEQVNQIVNVIVRSKNVQKRIIDLTRYLADAYNDYIEDLEEDDESMNLSEYIIEIARGEIRTPTGFMTLDAILNWRWDLWWDAIVHLVLPVTSLVVVICA